MVSIRGEKREAGPGKISSFLRNKHLSQMLHMKNLRRDSSGYSGFILKRLSGLNNNCLERAKVGPWA